MSDATQHSDLDATTDDLVVAVSDHDEPVIERPPPQRAGYSLPRGFIIGLGLAAAVIVIAGMHAVPQIIAPIFLALVVTHHRGPVAAS